MIHEIVKLQHIDILHIDPPTSDHGQFHSDHVKILALDYVFVIESANAIKLNHVQETLDLLTNLLPGIFANVFFLDPFREIDSTLEKKIFYIDLHQYHVPHLRLHLGDLSIIYNQIPLKIMATTLKAFQVKRHLWSQVVYHWDNKCYNSNMLFS